MLIQEYFTALAEAHPVDTRTGAINIRSSYARQVLAKIDREIQIEKLRGNSSSVSSDELDDLEFEDFVFYQPESDNLQKEIDALSAEFEEIDPLDELLGEEIESPETVELEELPDEFFDVPFETEEIQGFDFQNADDDFSSYI